MEELIELARQAREQAYCPYSGYQVGAAVRDAAGNAWTGCNVENVSYGVTLCAERVAVGKMVSGGQRILSQVAVATRDAGTPCGICLQTLIEFAPDPSSVRVAIWSEDGAVVEHKLSDLLPFAFKSDLKRT